MAITPSASTSQKRKTDTMNDDADENFKTLMRDNLQHAAAHFELTTVGEATYGWRLRSIGSAAKSDALGDCWLRLCSEFPEWTGTDTWTGNTDANALADIAKPRVLDVTEWDDGRRVYRAEVLTRVGDTPCSQTEEPEGGLKLPEGWWRSLHDNLERLSQHSTSRRRTDQEEITRRVRVFFGDRIDPDVSEWTTAHGDLHWSNLTAPGLTLLDWEHWGLAPAGYDAATLLCYSLDVPEIAARVRREFAAVLDTPSGLIAQLAVTARLLLRINDGDYPHMAIPLHRHADRLLNTAP